MRLSQSATVSFAVASLALGCDAPHTSVVLENDYPLLRTNALVVYHAAWQAVSFPSPVPPGSSSDPQPTVPASDNTAYVVLAPGWDPTSSTPPSAFVVLQSRNGFAVDLDDTLHIPIDDKTFAGHCEAGSFLPQEQADFITRFVFPGDFASVRYDARTCTTTRIRDAGAD
jgi:hypothetical protein